VGFIANFAKFTVNLLVGIFRRCVGIFSIVVPANISNSFIRKIFTTFNLRMNNSSRYLALVSNSTCGRAAGKDTAGFAG
jgi:hypothetical protein